MNEAPKKIEADAQVLQIRKIGNSIGVILPKDFASRHNFKDGDKLHVIEQGERGFKLTPYDPLHQKAMEIARKAFRTYSNTFRALAK